MKVIAFPYAGGNAYCYKPLERLGSLVRTDQQALQKFYVPELPGRSTLAAMPLLKDMNALADYLFEKIQGELQSPYAFFGHSMGALLAYLVTRRIERAGLPLPEGIVASGRKGPLLKDSNDYHQLPQAEFFQVLREMGGCPEEVLNDEELMAYFEPVLRADFQAIETYKPEQAAKLPIPIHVLLGMQDKVTQAEGEAWQAVSSLPIKLTQVEGNHFFIQQHWALIASIIAGLWFKKTIQT